MEEREITIIVNEDFRDVSFTIEVETPRIRAGILTIPSMKVPIAITIKRR